MTSKQNQRDFLDAICHRDMASLQKYVEAGHSLNFYTTHDKKYDDSHPLLVQYNPSIPADWITIKASFLDTIDVTWNNNHIFRIQEVTPLSYACLLNHEDIARYLVEHGAEVNVMDDKCGRLSSKRQFSSNWKFLSKQSVYFQPMWWACQHNNNNLVRFLLDHDADIEISHTHDRFTNFLQFACECGNIEIMEHLLRKGVNPNTCSDLLLSACYHNQHDMIRLLLSYHASPKMDPYICQHERAHTCLSTLERKYLENNMAHGFFIPKWQLDHIYHHQDADAEEDAFEDYDLENGISQNKEELETLALMIVAGEDLSTIRCHLIREWLHDRVAELERQRVKERTTVIEPELIEKTMHPDRFLWLLDQEQKKDWDGILFSDDDKNKKN